MEGDKPKTTVCIPFGLFKFNQMPFGLCNAPSNFKQLMERLFGNQQCQSFLLCLDAIVVFSTSVAQHLERLGVVLGHLEREGLNARLEKCSFLQQEVKYLGHIISSVCVATDPERLMLLVSGLVPLTPQSCNPF